MGLLRAYDAVCYRLARHRYGGLIATVTIVLVVAAGIWLVHALEAIFP
jgi:hypothetical protein